MIVVLMGVAGSGKTTVGTVLAERMGVTFADADDYHSKANKEKMAAGHPLNDSDRAGWLQTLNGILVGWFEGGRDGVLACSALKESYRSTLEQGMPDGTVTFCLLDLTRAVIAERLAARHHEYMNPQLLDSQIATLEAPSAEEAITVENDRTPAEVAEEILEQIRAKASGPAA